MKHTLLSLLVASLSVIAIELPLLERFDVSANTQGTLLNDAVVADNAGLDKGALKLIGNAAANRIFYTAILPITGGNSYVLALNYRTEKIQNYTFRIDVVYQGAKVKPESYNMIASNTRWSHKAFEFTAPEGVTSATVRMRLVKAATDNILLIDNLRVEQKIEGQASNIRIKEFATDFSDWSLDKTSLLEHFMLAPSGSIVKDATLAKSGGAFFKAVGNNAAMQYALYIENISVEARQNYVFNAFYKATDAFKANAAGMLIFFYKDAKGNAVGQSRVQLRSTSGEWKELSHSMAIPANCAFLDIGLNLRGIPESECILFDQLSFRRQ